MWHALLVLLLCVLERVFGMCLQAVGPRRGRCLPAPPKHALFIVRGCSISHQRCKSKFVQEVCAPGSSNMHVPAAWTCLLTIEERAEPPSPTLHGPVNVGMSSPLLTKHPSSQLLCLSGAAQCNGTAAASRYDMVT